MPSKPTTLPTDLPWRPGMRDTDGNIVLRVGSHGLPIVWWVASYGDSYGVSLAIDETEARRWWVGARPDLADGATRGALLDAVREAYPAWPAVCVQYRGSTESWQVIGRCLEYVRRHNLAILGEGPTEWDAIAAAWAARPGRSA